METERSGDGVGAPATISTEPSSRLAEPEPEPTPVPHPARFLHRAWEQWIRPAWYPGLAYLVGRGLGLLAIATSGAIQRAAPVGKLVSVWDGNWYTIIANGWYYDSIPVGPNGQARQSALAFFPGYPGMMRAVMEVTGLGPNASGFLITSAGGLLATVGVWAIARHLCGDAVARRSALLFSLFPGAFVFSFMYAEGAMLAFAVFALIAVMHRRWWLAGLLAAVATSIRPNALVLVLCFAWAAFEAIRQRREWRALVAPILAPVGTIAFFAIQGHRLGGQYGFWFRVQDEGWNQRTDFGVNTVKKFLWLVDDYSGVAAQAVLTVGLIVMVALLVCLWRWKPPAVLTIWAIGILFLAVSSESQGARPRYLLTAFPLIIAAARELDGEVFRWVLAISAALLMLVTALVAHPLTLEP